MTEDSREVKESYKVLNEDQIHEQLEMEDKMKNLANEVFLF